MRTSAVREAIELEEHDRRRSSTSWANEHATLVQAGSTGHLVAYVDGPQRSEPLVGAPGETIVAADGSGFDWGSAMVGASSALVLALLIGVSLVTVRRFRAGPLAH